MVKRIKQNKEIGSCIDDRHELFNMYASQCAFCKYFVEDDYYCKAFPDGIPDAILSGEQKHDSVIKGQAGKTVFAKK